jgi:hypothetical protein
VQFLDGGANFGAPVTVSGGQASLATTALTAGSHSLGGTFTPTDPAAFVASTATPVAYGVSVPPPPGPRLDVRTYDWSTVGRPTPPLTPKGSGTTYLTGGVNLINADVDGGITVTSNTQLIQNVHMTGFLDVYTGKHAYSVDKIFVDNPPGDGISHVDSVTDFRVEGIGNDGLKMSDGGGFTGGAMVVPPRSAVLGVLLNKGYLPAGSSAHADNMQLWSGRNFTFKRIFFGALPGPYPSGSGKVNSLIIIKSDIEPWDGSGDPITGVLLEDLYLDLSIGSGYNNVIYIREGGAPTLVNGVYQDRGVRFLRRPKLITMRGIVVSNLANGTKPTPGFLLNTSYQTDYAVFVRSVGQRDTGIANQLADPTVINARMSALSASRNGMIWPDIVDANSWIVLENDCVYQDGTPIVPLGGFYNLSAG